LFTKPKSYRDTYNLDSYFEDRNRQYNKQLLDDLKNLERYDDPKVRAKFLFESENDRLMFYFVPNEVLKADALVRYYYLVDDGGSFRENEELYFEGWAVDLNKVLLYRQRLNEFYMAEAVEALKRTLEKGNIEKVQCLLAPILGITNYGNNIFETIYSKLVECGKYAYLVPGCGSEELIRASSEFKVATENLSRAAAEE